MKKAILLHKMARVPSDLNTAVNSNFHHKLSSFKTVEEIKYLNYDFIRNPNLTMSTNFKGGYSYIRGVHLFFLQNFPWGTLI